MAESVVDVHDPGVAPAAYAAENAFRIGDVVVFGRPTGEKTKALVLGVNRKTLTLEASKREALKFARKPGGGGAFL